MTTTAKLDRLLRAYRPLQMRGTLVEGTYRRPEPPSVPPPRRMLLLALVGTVLRRGRP